MAFVLDVDLENVDVSDKYQAVNHGFEGGKFPSISGESGDNFGIFERDSFCSVGPKR